MAQCVDNKKRRRVKAKKKKKSDSRNNDQEFSKFDENYKSEKLNKPLAEETWRKTHPSISQSNCSKLVIKKILKATKRNIAVNLAELPCIVLWVFQNFVLMGHWKFCMQMGWQEWWTCTWHVSPLLMRMVHCAIKPNFIKLKFKDKLLNISRWQQQTFYCGLSYYHFLLEYRNGPRN